ncbi:MAG: hypothetical protein H0W96_12910 [Solirubrobacterales bacterium]|nr:hypothetical protein [Solirubrobacterales bacterium]
MTDPLTAPDHHDDRAAQAAPGMPRWVKVLLVVVLVAVVAVVVAMSIGGQGPGSHGPGRHSGSIGGAVAQIAGGLRA